MNTLPPIQNSENKKRHMLEDQDEVQLLINRTAQFMVSNWKIKRWTHLVVDFVEGFLQLPVHSGQLFEVSVGFMDGQQNLVHFVYGFVHGGLAG